MEEKGQEVVDMIVDVSKNGRGIKQNSVLYALAICARCHDLPTKEAAYKHLNEICRIPTHLFMFIGFCELESAGTGWGRLHRRSIADWYNNIGNNIKNITNLARLSTKYSKRHGWSHKDVLRLCHIKPQSKAASVVVIHSVKGMKEAEVCAKKYENDPHVQEVISYLRDVEKAKAIKEEGKLDELVELIERRELSREQISNTMLSEKRVWQALLPHMPVEAMIRNLGSMTQKKVLEVGTDEENIVLETLNNELKLQKARLHPFRLLVALKTYSKGMGEYGQLMWDKNPNVVEALETAFYRSFKDVEPTGKKFLVAIDVSGSMNVSLTNSPAVTARDAAAAMAMMVVRTEKTENCTVIPFSHNEPKPMDINPTDKLLDVHAKCMRYHFGRTDCAMPIQYAIRNNKHIDVFIVLTDSETYYGNTHPAYALREYRNTINPDAKLIVVGMTSSGFSIADPEDRNMMDMVGFDPNAPEIIQQFVNDFETTKQKEIEDMESMDFQDIHTLHN